MFYGTQYHSACKSPLLVSIQNDLSPHPISLRYILIVVSHPLLGHTSDLFPWGFTSKICKLVISEHYKRGTWWNHVTSAVYLCYMNTIFQVARSDFQHWNTQNREALAFTHAQSQTIFTITIVQAARLRPFSRPSCFNWKTWNVVFEITSKLILLVQYYLYIIFTLK